MTDISPRFLGLIEEEGLGDKRVHDIGCGWGRLSFALAPHALSVVGLDRDAELIAEARLRAAADGIVNVEFREADVDSVEYAPFAPDLVVSHLFASDAMVERAGRALGTGGCLAMVAFHVDQWRETGKASRFAYDESGMGRLLEREGLKPELIEVESEERRFRSVEEGLAAVQGLEDRWEADGRWQRYLTFLEAGGRTLTRSHLIVKARKP